MNLYSYVVTKNETDRYMAEFLEELGPYVDGLLIYDDQSADREALLDLAGQHIGVPVVTRRDEEFSFLEDESMFRQQAWDVMSELFRPLPGDWILALDADEFLRSPYENYVRELCARVQRDGHNALSLHIHEVWEEEPPSIRTDGFWAATHGIRLCQFQPGGKFKYSRMGGGSVPAYADNPVDTTEIDILHYGYAREADRQRKYRRYNGRTGHNRRHISSILETPTLAPLPPLPIE